MLALRDDSEATLIDALPYVEPPGDVNDLVESEMRAPSFVAPTSNFKGMAAVELARIDRGEDLEPLEIDRYNCEPTDDAERDRRNCWVQLEHQANRVVNLEFVEAGGEEAWKRHLKDLEALATQLRTRADKKRREADTINLKRKAYQEAMAADIFKYEAQRSALVGKHLQLERANAKLRRKLKPS